MSIFSFAKLINWLFGNLISMGIIMGFYRVDSMCIIWVAALLALLLFDLEAQVCLAGYCLSFSSSRVLRYLFSLRVASRSKA